MWLITTFSAALGATIFWLLLKKRYKLGLLSLMLWGATIMILVDHWLGYEGGKFFQSSTDGLIKNGILLGVVMLLPVFFVWFIALLAVRRKAKR